MEGKKSGTRKVKRGTVVSDKMNKTLVVRVERIIRHPRYEKVVTRAKKYYVHCEDAEVKVGDQVDIMETRPISKMKRWRVTNVVR